MTAASILLRAAGAAGAAALALVLAAHPASAAGSDRANSCRHPVSGVNLNQLFGVPEQLVAACGGPTAGERWRPFLGYFGAEASDAVYPIGYVPSYPSPVDDALSKASVRVVTDGGTRQEKTYTFAPSAGDAFRADVTLHDINPANAHLPGFIVIPRMAPLSPGTHTYQVIWVQSARHCDGLSTVEDESCLPAGEYPQGLRSFQVFVPERGSAG